MRRLLLLVLLTLPLFAAEPVVDDLGWIAGHWAMKQGELEVEEVWLAPKGNLMMGMSRTVKGGQWVSFEFIRIAKTDDGVAYIAQPRGRAPVAFKLVESKAGRAVFANPEHDFPKRIIYEMRGDQLCARVDDGKDGEEWCWSRR